MLKNSLRLLLCFYFVYGGASLAEASEIMWNGFASVYARESLTTNPRDSSTDDKGINFDNDTKVGLNMSSHFAKDWTAVGQIVASRRSITPANVAATWSPEFDWFFLNYDDPTTGLSMKVGRQLYPFSLTAEYVDVGLAYPWRELPEQFRTAVFFKSFEGLSLAYQKTIGESQFVARLFGGDARSGQPDQSNNAYNGYQINNLEGAVVSLEAEGWKLHATYSQFRIVITSPNFQTPPTPSTLVGSEFGSMNHNVTIGGTYDRHNIMGYLEYTLNCNTAFPDCLVKAYYGTLGYHLGAFLPHYTFALGDWDIPGEFNGRETSHGFGLNYQLDPAIVLKAEYLRQQDTGTAIFLTNVGWADSVALGLNVVF